MNQNFLLLLKSNDFLCDAGWERYGPRIGVRSIKPISKGEEITIAYTDLLQTRVYFRHNLTLFLF